MKKINYSLISWFVITIIISYLLIYFITPSDFFKSPMYMLLPIVGFFGMYYFTEYTLKYMEIKNKYNLLIIFLIVGIISYFLAFFFFYWNIINLNNLPMKELFKFIFNNYDFFFKSAFLEFIISGAIGIIASKK
ncbi:MAG: hypothetical protein PHX47_00595 [Candidatus ainarchaeum sp.]|jgi:hypothetical protein|nr:hypothetical protein [Candidatus ainarchaeum sp.]